MERERIIEALKICDSNYDGVVCKKCPIKDEDYNGSWYDKGGDCYQHLMREAAELLSEQSAIQPVATDTNVGDKISRQAAIDAVNNAFDRETLLTGFVRSIAVRAIRDMPPAQPEQRWILCSKRQPDANDWYITTISGEICGQDRAFSGMSEFANGKWMSGDDVDETEMTIAWMPLPEPYKEGENDE